MQEVKKSFWDIIAVTGSTALSLPLLIISESIQARVLGPEDYGKLTLVLSVISLAFLFGISWLQNAIVRFGKEEFTTQNKFNNLFTSLTLLTFLFLVLTSIAVIVFRNHIFRFVEIKSPQAIWIIILGVWFLTIKSFSLEFLKIIRLIKVQAMLFRVVSKVIMLLGMLLLLYVFSLFNISTLIIVIVFSDLLIFFLAIYYIKRELITPYIFNWNLTKKIVTYSLPLIFLSWSSYVVNWIDAYTIKYFLTMEHVGIYQAAYKILSTLKSFFGAGLITVFSPIIVVFVTNKEFSKISDTYIKRIIPQISFLTMIIVFAIIASSDLMLNLIYGNKFEGAITPFKILVTSLSFSVVSFAMTPVFTSLDMTKTLFFLGLYAGVVNIAADILLVPVFGIAGAALASLIVFSSHGFGSMYLIRKRFAAISYTSFIYPALVIPFCLVNVYIPGYLVRVLFSVLIIILSVILAKLTTLLKSEDLEILHRVDMPVFIKNAVKKLTILLQPK